MQESSAGKLHGDACYTTAPYARKGHRCYDVVFFDALTMVFAGLRIAVAVAFSVLIAAAHPSRAFHCRHGNGIGRRMPARDFCRIAGNRLR